MKFLSLLGLFAALFLFTACGDDEDDMMVVDNTILVAGVETTISNAYVTNEFFDFDSTLYNVIFTGEGLTLDDGGDFQGVGFVGFSLIRAAEGGLPNGTYTVGEVDMNGVFAFAYANNQSELGIFNEDDPQTAVTGTLTVGTAGSDRTFVLAVTTRGGETITMSYTGPLIDLDN